MTEIDRKDITPVLMALDTEFHRLQSKISNLVLDGEFESAHRYAKVMTAIIFAMNEFDRMAPRPDTPEMPVMAALYIKVGWKNRQKIPAIKILRAASFGFDLKEAKALLDAVEDGYSVFVGYIGEQDGNKMAQELFDCGWDGWCFTSASEANMHGLSKAISLEDIKAKRVPSLLY